MNSIRKFICVLTALMLAAFALPSMGAGGQSQNKTYTLAMSVSSQGGGLGVSSVQAILSNTSPRQSSSTFSSFELFVNFAWNISNCSVTGGGTANVDCAQTTPGKIVVQGMNPIKANASVTVTFDVDATSCGDATWNANVWSGSQIGSGNFFSRPVPDTSTPISTVACADLACNFDPVTGAPAPESFIVGGINGFRWSYNKIGAGSACDATNVYVSDVENTANPIHFRWDGASDTFSSAVFYYKIGYTTSLTNPIVGWLNKDGSLANAAVTDATQVAFVKAQACTGQVTTDSAAAVESILPQPYGTLKNPGINSTTTTTIKVDTSTGTIPIPANFPAVSFDIVVGPAGSVERMTVTDIQNSGWTVTRGVGTPNLGVGVKHSAGTPVMSILLPILPANNTCYDSLGATITCPANGKYSAPYQAQACIAVDPAISTPALWWVDIGDTWHLP